jgi:hypothetical protein
MKQSKILMIVALYLAALSSAEARRADTRPYSYIATKQCKTDSCYSRHPAGYYHAEIVVRHAPFIVG